MKFNYKKLQSHIVEPLPTVEVLREKIIFHAFEVESVEDLGEDYELEIKVLPDRAFDAKEDRGMAREIAALFNLTLVDPDSYDAAASTELLFSLNQVSALLGRTITAVDIEKMFGAYHYVFTISGDQVTLAIPPWRSDIAHVYDIADEVGRYFGYNSVEAVLPELSKQVVHDKEFQAIVSKKQAMIAQGYHEVMTYSLTKKGDYQVAKGPKGKDFLRTNLLDGMRVAYAVNKQNEELLPNASAKIFEIGKVFPKTGEELHVAWIDAKGEHEEVLSTEHSSSSQEEVAGGRRSLVRTGTDSRFHMWSEYPFMTRDIAVWLPESVSNNELISIINKNGTELLQGEPRLFDQFTKDGRTSYAYRIIFQAFDRTLTDNEVNPIMDAIYSECKSNNWEIR
jgi:phenylalanyl-tRNA synthetase beta subunit